MFLKEVRVLFYIILTSIVILQSIKTAFPGSYLNNFLYIIDKDFSISDVTGVKRLFCRLHNSAHRYCADNNFYLDLRKKREVYWYTAVIFRISFLCATAKYLSDRNTTDADIIEC